VTAHAESSGSHSRFVWTVVGGVRQVGDRHRNHELRGVVKLKACIDELCRIQVPVGRHWCAIDVSGILSMDVAFLDRG
jgi:hypothetical protein